MNEIAKLKWQCRRGTKELDLLLMNYLENRYVVADDDQKKNFADVLKLDDHELLASPWFYAELISLNYSLKSD